MAVVMAVVVLYSFLRLQSMQQAAAAAAAAAAAVVVVVGHLLR
jgi:hypothetical protein